MAYDLSIDMHALRELAKDLKTIGDEFQGTDERADEAASATGDAGLHDTVHDFSAAWRIKRDEMTENVDKLQGILQQIVDTFTEVDADLAKALEKGAERA
ncbi:hypothetical protein [Luteimicrobium subarcticum]|uniref:Excreted virulence factor EspC (Type VII ESX diderm) n=1 Tax=Luteimicrobium subarcticum TaxID=620910 RepID=A0A2M8WVM9_9MICO|nr:hypothetical protein [Luteimicrobium subarcticum]PJI94980.1 hypothetical protein CLV34_0832 [Luteimicrobium subarcticum]